MRGLGLILLLCYPFAVHLSPGIGVAILIALLLQIAWSQWQEGTRWAVWVFIASLWLALFLWWSPDQARMVLYLPPILINLLLLWLFAHTLFPPHRPLITLFAEQFHQVEANLALVRYTRGVTLIWSWVFAALAIESTMLALWASRETWSLFTNLINYLLVLIVFLIERKMRLIRLPNLDHPGLIGFLLALKRIDPRTLLKS